MKLFYDFHIHSALSPCGDEDMTPNNIVNMALIKELDAIAVTDHNSAANCGPCMELGREKGLIVLPGMEVQTKEEVHVLCLFQSLGKIKAFEEEIYGHYEILPNRPEVFGRQLVLDAKDGLIREEPRLLIHSIDLNIHGLVGIVHRYGGLAIAAHVDRKAFSLIANLGFISPDLGIDAIELSKRTTQETFVSKNPMYGRYRYLSNSDAHYLQDISEREHWLEVREKSVQGIFECLGGGGEGAGKQ